MNLRAYILLFCIVFSWGAIFAQLNPKLKIGKDFTNPYRVQFQGFIGTSNDAIYSVESKFSGSKLKNIYIGKYDKSTLKQLFLKPILPQSTNDYTFNPIEIFMIENAIYLCCEAKESNTNNKFIAFFPISSSGKLGNFVKLGNIGVQDVKQERFFVVSNEAKNRFLLVRNLEEGINKHQKIEVAAYSSNLQLYWKDTITFPYVDYFFSFEEFQYDGNEKIVFLAQNAGGIQSKNDVILPINNNNYFLFSYTHKFRKIKEIEIKIDDKHIQSIKFNFNENGLVAGGYFSNHHSTNMDGVYSIVIDQNFEFKNATIHSFSDRETLLFYKTKTKTAPNQINDLVLKKIIYLPNGNFGIIGEQYYVETQTNYDMQMRTTTHSDVYNYDNLLVSMFNPKGELLNNICLHKYQSTYNDNGFFSSFFAGNSGNNIFILFNGSKRNSKLMNEDYLDYKIMKKYNSSCLYMLTIDAKRNVNKNVLLKDKNSLFVPKLSNQLSDEFFYLFSQKRNNYKLMTLSF